MTPSLDGFVEHVTSFLAEASKSTHCARPCCRMPLPRNLSLGEARAGRKAWALLTQLVVDDDGRLRITGGAFCVECASTMRGWVEAKFPETKLKRH